MISLADAVGAARARYVAANPASSARYTDALAVLPGGNTRTVLFHEPFPLGIVRGEGCVIWDADGHAYVDLLGEYTAGLFGHSDPVIRAAVVEALENGVTLSGHPMAEARFAAAVADRFPSMELLRFTNSGTEANLMALATATVATGRRRVLVFEGAYHGGVLSFPAGYDPKSGGVNVPHEWVVAEYNNAERARDAIRGAGDELAAVLVEPMLGSGGCIPADPDFLAVLRAETERAGAVLIFDEVMTSRLAPGGRQAALGIRPDLTTLGKYVGGGMSFGAFGGRRDLMARYDPRRPDALAHAGTFNNNVLTMSAGLAALTRVLTPAALAALNDRGERLRAELNRVFAGLPARATGLGSLLTVHFTDRPLRTGADVALGDPLRKELFFFDLLHRGFHLARRGMVALSLPVGDDECTRFVEAVADFVDERRHLISR
ncbi:aspartate aminotransferase family protein [Dactylosporangium fulvum]|uniref:Aminotransferase class III-fold pyridoxal phosphate-dependent enzyme n=1 Tax=Dactylosporangium fulvum TaxID=53359 RepID=A0ABY5VMV4_9ACTN|nr:aminotransferase class III-fold pyridoxal phosphate-dependent enzyme [Dactylosporangium fulvum]UWP79057.1 aminotransferase class III-fold pyridoxal phosphate-dependent enzyme [Dactylosporangium fulvum]